LSLDDTFTLRDVFCVSCNHEHKFNDGILNCSEKFCFCQRFINSDALILTDHQKMFDKLKTIKDKIKYMYEKIGGFENFSNKAFIFAYWHYNNRFCTGMLLDVKTYNYLEDPESIRRCRQKFCADNPQYQVNDKEVEYGRMIKFNAIVEFVTQ